jgi:hypothetical protein
VFPASTRTASRARVVCVTAVLLAATAPAGAADVSSLTITAGAGGLVKAGRWVPVHVSLALADDAADPEVIVSWGTATVRRAVAAGGEAGRRLELYIRTPEAAGAMIAQLRSGGRVVAQAEAAVRALPQAEPLVACVDDAQSPDCSVYLKAEDLPSSLRGYEAIDRLVFDGEEAALGPEQRAALAAWRELQRLNEGGNLGLVAQPARPTLPRGLPAPLLRGVAAIALVYVGVLLVIGLARPLPWRVARRGGLVLAGVVAAGSATVLAFGAGLPERPVVVHHSSLVEQLPGGETAMLAVRAIAEFPAVGRYELRWPLSDAMLESSSAVAGTEHLFEAGGHPILPGRRGLGTRLAFSGEATAALRLLTVRADGTAVTVSNDSSFNLTACRFGAGFEPALAGALAAGGSVSANRTGQPAGPLLVCTYEGIVIPFEEPASAVLSTGSTTIAVYQ